jgi:ATP-dependent DNA helicase RecG
MGIKELIDKGETQSLEFKESLRLKDEIGETVSAFSNSDGGTVIVGVSDSGGVPGVDIGKNSLEELANYIKRNTDPRIFPSVKILERGGKNVVMVEVKECQEKPVFFKNHAYKRVGKTNQRISAAEIRKLAREEKRRLSWDEQICEKTFLEDIDEKKIRWFVREAGKQRRLNITEDAPIEEVLVKLKLLADRKLTNVAVLLFSRESKFLQSEVKCIRFSGNEPVKPYIDFQTLEGTVFDLVDGAEVFVLRNIKKSIWLVPGQLQREERYEYPPDAIREAIVNAVVHRDYESPSKVEVRVFDNRIEVWNPGLLPEGITLEDLKREHRSIPRNPLLFRQLFWVKYVEDVGGGTLDMIKWCKEWGLPEPDFKFITGATVVVFRLPPKIGNLEKLGLNERQIRAVNYVVKQGSITNREYQTINNTTRYTATRDLGGIVKEGIFDKIGEGKRDLKYVLIQNAAKMRQKNTQKGDDSG